MNRMEAIEFAVRAMTCPAVGAKPEHARAIGEALVGGDYRGHFSHGLQRLGLHLFMNDERLLYILYVNFYTCNIVCAFT